MTDARRYTGSLASSANMTASTSAEVNPFSERAISYDRNGNITALTRYGQAAASAEDILAYTYSGNRIASIANTGTLGGGGSYSHDANGNVTHDSRGSTSSTICSISSLKPLGVMRRKV